ncbi:MAG: vanadium-dependent haloperoxidase [Bryobacterales bacterium]|nr:vanadium-dependent haloperoxidase [Bryobacterales bacterium]MBV9397282.1 vanadium-dependent haloperoxidase [Bryobacterales bacterium]
MSKTNQLTGIHGPDRRKFLSYLGAAPALGLLSSPSAFADTGPLNASERRDRAFAIRQDAAIYQRDLPATPSISNGDEEAYANRIASFTKGLPHNDLGEVDPNAYNAYLQALNSGNWADFEAIPLGGAAKLSNPQAAYCYTLEGADAAAVPAPPSPAFSSAQAAGEMVEDYWQALTRDVPFSQYGTDATIAQAVADLNKLSDFRGPKVNWQVTPDVIFRGPTPGDLAGPYLSQFLLKPVPMGAATMPQLYRTAIAGDDYWTSYADWLNGLRGRASGSNKFDSTSRYIRNGRDLALYLLVDWAGQANVMAALILNSFGAAAVAASNPYLHSATQVGSITFGAPSQVDLVTRVSNPAYRAGFYQKWLVHRRVRPEAFGGRIHNLVTGAAKYPIHSDVLNSAALKAVFSATGSYLLPQAYPVGSPLHPSYPATHAVVAGAGITVLKALFDESFIIPSPVTPSDDGLSLVPYTGGSLTVGGELNKLASNIALGRDAAGVHYRSDGVEGIKLGEAIAISILRDTATLYNEPFPGFSFTKYEGTPITISPNY